MSLRYQNPVYAEDFADPFILKTRGAYYAYGTAASGEEGRIFPVLWSTDLVHWTHLGGALAPLSDGQMYWAPEVIEKDGRYYLFYSASTGPSEEFHRLRVAISEEPAGPFMDSGRLLLPQMGFTIDADPFRDPVSGKYFLFFATDFESDEPYGTGLAVVPLADDLLSVINAPRCVIRAQADWQIYQRQRQYKGRLWQKWNCVEGPCCLFHEGRYYCLYSGGAWFGEDYGVGFAVADTPLGPWKDELGAIGPSILRAIPGKVMGPGHNSAVSGPSGRTTYLVYHAWNAAKTARCMHIDPLIWTAHGPKLDGPSFEPRELIG